MRDSAPDRGRGMGSLLDSIGAAMAALGGHWHKYRQDNGLRSADVSLGKAGAYI